MSKLTSAINNTNIKIYLKMMNRITKMNESNDKTSSEYFARGTMDKYLQNLAQMEPKCMKDFTFYLSRYYPPS